MSSRSASLVWIALGPFSPLPEVGKSLGPAVYLMMDFVLGSHPFTVTFPTCLLRDRVGLKLIRLLPHSKTYTRTLEASRVSEGGWKKSASFPVSGSMPIKQS